MQKLQLNGQAGLPAGQAGKSYVKLVAVIGLVIAAAAFFTAFITTQKANTPKPYSNLRIPPIQIPSPPPVEPLLNSTPTPEQVFPPDTFNVVEVATSQSNLEPIPPPPAEIPAAETNPQNLP